MNGLFIGPKWFRRRDGNNHKMFVILGGILRSLKGNRDNGSRFGRLRIYIFF